MVGEGQRKCRVVTRLAAAASCAWILDSGFWMERKESTELKCLALPGQHKQKNDQIK